MRWASADNFSPDNWRSRASSTANRMTRDCSAGDSCLISSMTADAVISKLYQTPAGIQIKTRLSHIAVVAKTRCPLHPASRDEDEGQIELEQEETEKTEISVRKGIGQDGLSAINAEHAFGRIDFAATGTRLGRVFDGHAIHDDFPILNLLNQVGQNVIGIA